MSRRTCRRTVAASPEVVWEVLSAFDRIAEWADAVDHSSALTTPAAGPEAARRVQVGSTVLVERITGWTPTTRLAYEIEGLPPVVAAVANEWSIGADGLGSTVALTVDVTPMPSRLRRPLAGMVSRRIGRTNESMLDSLARAAEGAPTT